MNESNLRSHRLKGNILVIFITKGLSILISLLYIPLLLGCMDTDNYAVWLTLTSLISWIALFDIGIGNGLRNRLSEALANKQLELGKQYVSTAYFGVIVVSILLVLCFFIANPFVNWQEVLNSEQLTNVELSNIVTIVFCGFILNFIFSLLNSILYAIQYPSISSTIIFSGQILSFLVVYILVHYYHNSSLIILSFVISIIPPLTYFVYSLILFRTKLKHIAPDYRFIEVSKIKCILSLGLKFFCLQIVTIVLFQTNNIIIIHAVNKNSVVIYNILYKYLYIIVTVFTILCSPIWSATTEAYVKNDFEWIRNIRMKLVKISILLITVGLIMAISSKIVFKIWLGNECPYISYNEVFVMFLYCAFMILYSTNGYIINGIGKISLQLYVTALIAIVYLPLAFFAGKMFGLIGILIAMSSVSILNYIWSQVQLSRILNKTAMGIWDK